MLSGDIVKKESLGNQNNQSFRGQLGGARPGAGRPKGKMNRGTLDRLAVKRAFEQRVARNADRLFDVQFNLARGEQYLMHKFKVGHGSREHTEVEIVTDPQTIKDYINEELNSDLSRNADSEDDYYYISTKPANGMAIDSLLDRAFGKAPQKMELEHSGGVTNGPYDPEKMAEFNEWLKDQSISKTI